MVLGRIRGAAQCGRLRHELARVVGDVKSGARVGHGGRGDGSLVTLFCRRCRLNSQIDAVCRNGKKRRARVLLAAPPREEVPGGEGY